MIDFTLITSRLFQLLLVPMLLLFPWIFALCTKKTVTSEADLAAARARMMLLGLGTLASLLFWLGMLLTSVFARIEPPSVMASWSWVLFFPLWFLLAMPALRARNPSWSGAHGVPAQAARTASLQNRQRQNPITNRHWIGLSLVVATLLLVLLARGVVMPFESEGAWSQWLIMTISYSVCVLGMFALPHAMRMALAEPEPLDSRGSEELIRLYDEHRTRRVRGLFWLLAVALPVLLGVALVIAAWTPWTAVAGILGAVGGSLVGLAGAWFGISMSIQRVRIAETRARLDSQPG